MISITSADGFFCIETYQSFVTVGLQGVYELNEIRNKLFPYIWFRDTSRQKECVLLIIKSEATSGLLARTAVRCEDSETFTTLS